MKINNYLLNGLLVLCAFTPLFWAHSYVFQSHLRHGMVEDGSISQYAGDLLDSRTILEKYSAILASDGKANGRYRPGYYLYETLPFFLTLIKNGDYDFGMSPDKIRGRVNGDLQFHMIYLLLTIGISLFFGSLLVYNLSGSFLYSAIFPLTVVFSVTLIRNITYNDTAEVPQLFAFSGYILLFFLGELAARKAKKICWVYLMAATPLLVFLYLVKETAAVLFPAILLYVVIFMFTGRKKDKMGDEKWKANFFFLIMHLVVNALLFVWLMFQVNSLKGGYSGNYTYKSLQQLSDALISYGKILVIYPPSVYLPIISFALIIIILIISRKRLISIRSKVGYVTRASFLLLSIAFGLLLLNLPWEFIGVRYMLPVAFFSSLAGCVILGFIDSLFCKLRRSLFYLGRVLLLIFVFYWSYPVAVKEKIHIDLSYQGEYGVHEVINKLTEDIIRVVKNNDGKVSNVLLDTGNMSHWMWIQAARIINREGKLNVVVPGQKYPPERLYLRQYNNAQEVTLVVGDRTGDNSIVFDAIYTSLSLSDPSNNTEKLAFLERLKKEYGKNDEWTVSGNPNEQFLIVKYLPRIDS